MAVIHTKLKSIKIPDISGTEKVSPIGKVSYSLWNIQLADLELPQSSLGLVTGTGVQLSIGNAYLKLTGNWKVKYLRFIKDHGSLDLSVSGVTITTSIAVMSDETGRPAVRTAICRASVGQVKIKFHGGASWLYNLFRSFIEKVIRNQLETQICHLVADAVSGLNPQLKTLNVLAKVDQYAEIEYSMVSSPNISQSIIQFNLKGEFYNIGKHKEPPITPSNFSMPNDTDVMMSMGMSAFTANSAAFVYNTAGVLSLYITDNMIPKSSPFRLSTNSFGVFVPQLKQLYPDLLMKLLVKTVKNPVISFEPNNMTIQSSSTVTAYAIQPNGTLSPLFVLNLESTVSADVFVKKMKLAGEVKLYEMDLTLATSYVGEFKVKSLENIFHAVLKMVIIPKLNDRLAKGYPLPAIGKMELVNTKLQILKGFMLIGTDVQFID